MYEIETNMLRRGGVESNVFVPGAGKESDERAIHENTQLEIRYQLTFIKYVKM